MLPKALASVLIILVCCVVYTLPFLLLACSKPVSTNSMLTNALFS